jgi:hypothetical protein
MLNFPHKAVSNLWLACALLGTLCAAVTSLIFWLCRKALIVRNSTTNLAQPYPHAKRSTISLFSNLYPLSTGPIRTTTNLYK